MATKSFEATSTLWRSLQQAAAAIGKFTWALDKVEHLKVLRYPQPHPQLKIRSTQRSSLRVKKPPYLSGLRTSMDFSDAEWTELAGGWDSHRQFTAIKTMA